MNNPTYQTEPLDCYIINLDRSPDRWSAVAEAFRNTGVRLIRLPGVDISQMETPPGLPDFDRRRFLLRQGREAVPGEVGCYLSHLKALRTFLSTDAPFALICEDDILPEPNLAEVLREACRYAHAWDLLRVMKHRHTGMVPYATLATGHRLCTAITDFIYAAGYLVNRRGAERLVKKLSRMTLPYDLALMAGWPGIRESALLPGAIFLADNSQQSTMDTRKLRLSPLHPRWWTAMIYKICARCWRYGLQALRALRLKCFPPRQE